MLWGKARKQSGQFVNMRSPIPHKLPYRADIDGLRAFAVLAVIIYHASPHRLPGGFIGVDVFFVISGFLITSLILESCHSGTFSYWDFYARRIRRILPALLIVLGASLLTGAILLLPHPFQDLARIVASAVISCPISRFGWRRDISDPIRFIVRYCIYGPWVSKSNSIFSGRCWWRCCGADACLGSLPDWPLSPFWAAFFWSKTIHLRPFIFRSHACGNCLPARFWPGGKDRA